MFNKDVYEYRKRREKRLSARGYRTKVNEYRKTENGKKVEEEKPEIEGSASESSDVRMDAPEQEQQNNQGGGGGHGNTKLPFGLCMRYGIDIQKEWTPSDAWAALKSKGVTPASAYTRLKQGKDPGKPLKSADTEKPKEPKKTFLSHGKEISDVEGKYRSWSSEPYSIEGKAADGEKFYRKFTTKSDMYQFLKEKGVEEFKDPVTTMTMNPQDVELPKVIGGVGTYPQKYFSGVTIGLRKGKYAVVATGLEGKKETLKECHSLADAQKFLDDIGVADEERKISPSVRKREKERLAWKDSDKKEYIEEDGVKYGDLKLVKEPYGRYEIWGSSEDGEPLYVDCGYSRSKAYKYLQKQGVERIKDLYGGYENPMEYEIPETIATVSGTNYTEIGIKKDPYGSSLTLYGKDEDGREVLFTSMYSSESYDDFIKRATGKTGLSEDKFTINEEAKQAIEDKKKDDAEKERRIAEFEEKAVSIGGRKFTDLSVVEGRFGYSLMGYDKDGVKRVVEDDLTKTGMMQYAEENGIDLSAITDDSWKEDIEKYQDFKQKLDKEGVQILGKKYLNPTVERYSMDSDYYYIKGINDLMEEESVTSYMDMYEISEFVERRKLDVDQMIKDPEVRKAYDDYQEFKKDFEERSIEYMGKRYADLKVESDDFSDYSGYRVIGQDARGRRRILCDPRDYDEMCEELKSSGVSVDDLPMDDEAKEKIAKDKKIKEAVATGEYYKPPSKREAYKDLRIVKNGGYYDIVGTDIDGNEGAYDDVLSYDQAIEKMERLGLKDYKIYIGDKVYDRPTNGMHKVVMMRGPDGFKIMATTDQKKTQEVHSCDTEEEARKWLRDNGVDDSTVKTKGMNPNDDVPRTHTAKSLESFDQHRADSEEDYPTLSEMDSATKQEVVDMLTDVFDQGAYRMRMRGHFEDVFDGHFENLLESHTSGGSTSEEGRRITGEKTFGHSYDIEPIDAEKYGYLGVEDDAAAFESGIASWYGGIVYKFKKSAVGDRVTYTAGDTLDAGRPLAGYAGSKPTYEGVSALSGYSLNDILEQYRKYKAGKISYSEFHGYLSSSCKNGYMECQYHGMLTMDDVETITFPQKVLKKSFDSMTPEKRQKVVTGLKERGIILQYVDANNNLADGYELVKTMYGF